MEKINCVEKQTQIAFRIYTFCVMMSFQEFLNPAATFFLRLIQSQVISFLSNLLTK